MVANPIAISAAVVPVLKRERGQFLLACGARHEGRRQKTPAARQAESEGMGLEPSPRKQPGAAAARATPQEGWPFAHRLWEAWRVALGKQVFLLLFFEKK
ncbi:MAG: hypothetical protein D6730_15600 [Bacteroidetes bacterium]|nr:MAG: hypothetical protein D6730_15600 [Bacteroidota bacterium]